MKILTSISEDEKNEIQELFERLFSLNSLASTLSEEKLNLDEQNWLYKKLTCDLIETRKKFNKWWIKICKEYNLNKKDLEHYSVNFEENFIFS